MFKLSYCEECGEVRVPHAMTSVSYQVGYVVKRFTSLNRFLTRTSLFTERQVLRILSPERVSSIARFCERIRIGTFDAQPTKQDNTRTQALYEGADPSGVRLHSFKLFGTPICFVAEKEIGGRVERILFDIIPRPKGFVSPSLPWMDDKGVLKQKLIEGNLPCAAGDAVRTFDEAVQLFRKIGRPVITKPRTGSRGRHTTLDIRNEEELKRGFEIAQQLTPYVIVETYLKGTVHRVTLVGGEPVAVARREYPHVIGDGVHTVLELIDIENQAPYRNGVHFRKLDTKHRIGRSLKKQNLTFESIPEAGCKVILNDKNSRLHGTLTEDVTETVHPENLVLFRRLGTVLADPIVGVDFMIDDMHRPWREQPDSGFIECNSMPFIDVHHRVVSGKQINVAELLWNEVFRTSAPAKH